MKQQTNSALRAVVHGVRRRWTTAALLAGAVLFAAPLHAQAFNYIDTPEFKINGDATLFKWLAGAPCPAHGWQANFTSDATFSATLGPLRRQLLDHVGEFPSEPAGLVIDRKTIFEGPRYLVEFIELTSRLDGVKTFGYLATPKMRLAKQGPAVIVVHGSGTLPQQVFGWRFNMEGGLVSHRDSAEVIGIGITLVEEGYTVFAPWIGHDNQLAPYFPMLEVDKWGALMREKTGRGGAYTFIAANLMAVTDFLMGRASVDGRVAIAGWNEDGAQIASVMGILDGRISAVVRLAPPLDWPAYRHSPIGSRYGAGFSQMDCSLGDPELAAMMAPKPLLFAYSKKGSAFANRQAYYSPGVLKRVKDEYTVFGAGKRVAEIVTDTLTTSPLSPVSRRVANWLDTVFTFYPKDAIKGGDVPVFETPPDYPVGLTSYLSNTVSDYENRFGACVPVKWKPSYESSAAYHNSVREIRPEVARQAGFRVPRPGQAIDTLDRHMVLDTTNYTLEYLRLKIHATGVEIRGLMATPKGAVRPMPAVLSIDGNSDLLRPFGLENNLKDVIYLNAYAEKLLRQGMVVFSVYMSPWFQQGASAALRGRDPSGATTGWAFLVPYYMASIDVLWNHPGVDRSRIATYGISFAGVASLVVGSMDDRVSTVVYSDVPVDQREIFKTGGGALLQTWWIDLCHALDIQFKMIAPRRLVWEAGEDPNFQNTAWDVVQDVRKAYDKLGLSDHFQFVRHGGGHETRAEALRLFPNP